MVAAVVVLVVIVIVVVVAVVVVVVAAAVCGSGSILIVITMKLQPVRLRRGREPSTSRRAPGGVSGFQGSGLLRISHFPSLGFAEEGFELGNTKKVRQGSSVVHPASGKRGKPGRSLGTCSAQEHASTGWVRVGAGGPGGDNNTVRGGLQEYLGIGSQHQP